MRCISWVSKRQRSQKPNCQCSLDHGESKGVSLFGSQQTVGKETGVRDHLTCLLRNLYTGQEITVRTLHGTTDWFKIGKEYNKAIYCHAAYLTYMLSTSCQMLGYESQAGIMIARRNINNLRNAESEEELKSLLMRVKEEWRNWLKT